ncbi:MAG: hypothetical protein AB7N76_19135 [Planctomycetota bacterium]
MTARLAATLCALSLALIAAGCPGGGSAPAPKKKTEKTEKTAPVVQKKEPKPKKPFDRKTLKTPWKDAQVGQWATYSMGGSEVRFEVTKVEETTVTWARTDKDGKPQGSPIVVDLATADEKYQGAENMDLVEKDKIEAKKMKVGDQEIEVKVVRRNMRGSSAENWITSAVPPFCEVGGEATAKSARDGSVKSELVAFGKK